MKKWLFAVLLSALVLTTYFVSTDGSAISEPFQKNKTIVTNLNDDESIFLDLNVSTVDTNIGLTDLNDGEASYSGFAGKFLQVLPGENGWTFADANSSGLTEADGNDLYVHKNPLSAQTITSFETTFDQNINAGDCVTIGTSHAWCVLTAGDSQIRGTGAIRFIDSGNLGTLQQPVGLVSSNQGFRQTVTGGTGVRINPNSYFGGLNSVLNSGIYFNTATFNSFELHNGGAPIFRAIIDQTGAGIVNLIPFVGANPLTSAIPNGSVGMRDFQTVHDGNQFYQKQNGVWSHINSKMTIDQTPNDGVTDANWMVDTNYQGLFAIDGNISFTGHVDLGICNTEDLCINSHDENAGVLVRSTYGGQLFTGVNVKDGGNVYMPNLESFSGITQPVALKGPELVASSSGSQYKVEIEDLNSIFNTSLIYNIPLHVWKDASTGSLGLGVVAEEVLPVYPQFVFFDEQGVPDSVSYDSLFILSIAELQKKNAEIIKLQSEVQALDSTVSDLNNELFLLKSEFCKQFPQSTACVVAPMP